MADRRAAYVETPIGLIEILGGEAGVAAVRFVDGRKRPPGRRPALPFPLAQGARQLEEYFRGLRRTFSVPLDLRGTEFQMKVWRELLAVPFGGRTTYKELAAAVGSPAGTRAVGGANHSNPVSVIVPCHRVVGSDGRLTGYGGGLWRKAWLLRHESPGLFPD